MTTAKIPYEHDEQAHFVTKFRDAYPGVLIFAIPNAAKRSAKLAAYMKAEGLTAGIPDLCIPAWRVYIEMKRQKGGVVSKEQRNVMAYLAQHGYTCQVCNGWREALTFVEKHVAENGIVV